MHCHAHQHASATHTPVHTETHINTNWFIKGAMASFCRQSIIYFSGFLEILISTESRRMWKSVDDIDKLVSQSHYLQAQCWYRRKQKHSNGVVKIIKYWSGFAITLSLMDIWSNVWNNLGPHLITLTPSAVVEWTLLKSSPIIKQICVLL